MKRSRNVPWHVALIAGALLASATACQRGSGTDEGPVAAVDQAQSRPARGLDPSQVCFINNKYMGKAQIPVEIDGKTYYGCCAGCATALRNDPASRVANDPYSGAPVDKATAFIARNPADPETVLYFESAETFAAYSRGRG